MKVEITNDCEALSVTEVVQQLIGCGALEVGNGERLGESRLECGCDLEIDIMTDDPSDPRIHGCLDHTETFTLDDLRTYLADTAEYLIWVRDANGDDYLACFGI